jgi:hypothetical protein
VNNSNRIPKCLKPILVGIALILLSHNATAQDKTPPRQALQVFNDLIGAWRCTGTPAGAQKGFWVETMTWEWQFKGDDAWIKIDFAKSRHFLSGTLRYVPAKEHFALTLQTLAKETRTFTGTLDKRVLTLEGAVGDNKERLVFTLLHANRFLYREEVRTGDRPVFTRLYQVGATKEGVPFALGDGKPECIVSGGAGTMPVSYQGNTYYVCCSGCRDEFVANPEKYIKEYNQKKLKK